MDSADKDRMSSTMLHAIQETFETMAFLEVFSAEDPDDSGPMEEMRCVSLMVYNPFWAKLKMEMPDSMLQEIGEAIFSIPAEEIQEKVLKDLLAELLNTIGGRFLTEFLPSGKTFELGLPEHELDSEPESEHKIHRWHLRAAPHRFAISLRRGSEQV